jgi:hypothetical protein
MRRNSSAEEVSGTPLLCCVCCCFGCSGAFIAATLCYSIFAVYVIITTPYFGMLASPKAPSSIPDACVREWNAHFPGSIFDWILALNAIQGFILPLALTWISVHLLACCMTKVAAAKWTCRVVPPLLMLSGLYLTVCGILMWRSVSKECESVYQSKPYANLYWCFHVEVMLSVLSLLAQLVAPQSQADAFRSDYSFKVGERGRETAMHAEEEGRLLAENAGSDEEELSPADAPQLPPLYVPEYAQDQTASSNLRRQNSSIVGLAEDAHGQTGLSAALVSAALTRQPAQLSRQLSQTLQARTNPETEGFV